MHIVRLIAVWLVTFFMMQAAYSQPTRIKYNNQQLFLSGANLAWVNFGSDIGPGNTDFDRFADILLQMHDNGGNAARWWLHTNGVNSPQFNDSGFVLGPGAGTIADIRKVLDLAWEREIGIKLCLWSFDMLRSSNSATVLSRNQLLLNDTNYTRRYINTCLIPMIDSLRGHPGIIAWEIFNEPEGMSNEFGWDFNQHVPMSSIQRFVNLCAGAIHRTDSSAQVTNGAWSFYALADIPFAKVSTKLSKLSSVEKLQIATFFQKKYRTSLTPDEIMSHLDKIAAGPNQNYYRDDRLIAAGGDPKGTLDFFSVHYYSTSTPISTSPFNNLAVTWGLNKPIVVAEFAMESGRGNPPGITSTSLLDTLYHLGYAGALPWSFTDPQFSSSANMLAGMQSMWDNHRSDVDVLGMSGAWPIISLNLPTADTTVTDTASITLAASASSPDGTIASVEFFHSDTVKIGQVLSAPYTIVWKAAISGIFNVFAVATDDRGHKRISKKIIITVGIPPKIRFEAESFSQQGPGFSVKSDNTASGGAFVDAATNDATSKITWYLSGVKAGTYEISFGYKLFYASPKSQYINVNDALVGTLEFSGASTSTWYEKSMNVSLVEGSNTIQMQMFWGWMYVDYLAVPRIAFPALSVGSTELPTSYSLEQNYPNPFNPTTTIHYALARDGYARIALFDLLGREIVTLVDKKQQAGVYDVSLDASKLASGVYFYRLTAGSFTQIRKMLLLR